MDYKASPGSSRTYSSSSSSSTTTSAAARSKCISALNQRHNLTKMPPKGILKVKVTDCASPGETQIAITDALTVEDVLKTCFRKRSLDDHLPWWLVVSEQGEDARSAGVRQPAPLLISEIISDASSAGKDSSNLVWTLLQDAAATAEASAAAEAKAKRAASKTTPATPAAPSVPANFTIVAGILSKIGCSNAFSKFQEEELDDSTLEDLEEEYVLLSSHVFL